MPGPPRGWTDEPLEQVIGNLLRFGVILSAGVVLIGGLVYLFDHGAEVPRYQVFLGEPADLRSIRGIVKEALEFESRGLIQFGLLLLVATPVARVFLSVLAFALERDRIYVLVTSIVLALLIYSLAGVN